jgi:hypothetical protein
LTNPPRDSLSEIRRLVRRHDTLLREIAHNTRHTRRTHAPDAPLSILGKDDGKESTFSQLIDDEDIEEKGFESLVLNTKVYSNAFTRALQPKTNDDESDDACTITETQSISHTTAPKTPMVTVATGAIAEVHPFAINAPKIGTSIQKLGITAIVAWAGVKYKAQSDEELSFKEHEYINSVQKLTKSRYQGSLVGNPGKWGHFDRKMVGITLRLGSPLRCYTVNTIRKPFHDNYLTYKHGESLFITVSMIHHSFAIISDPKLAHSA